MVFHVETKSVCNPDIGTNEQLLEVIADAEYAAPQHPWLADELYLPECISYVVIEMVSHYGTGMPVGKSVFDTCVWIGRFIQEWARLGGVHYALIQRQRIKALLCGSARAKDANVRQALIDRWGGREKAIGRKACPGPLYGVKTHIWAALAVAVAFCEMREQGTQ